MRSPGSSPKRSSLSRCMRRPSRRSGCRSAGSSVLFGRSPDSGRLRCVRTWHAGERAPRVRGAERAADARPRRGASRPRSAHRRARVDLRRAGGRELPARGGGAAQRVCTPAFGFPLRSPGACSGVMEFFSRELREPDSELLATMDTAREPDRPVRRRRQAEEDVRANESRLRAMLEAALDAVVTMDALRPRRSAGTTLPTAIFGYHPNEAIGREMARADRPARTCARHTGGGSRALAGDRRTAWSSTAGSS